jgi:hypothetical protein
MTNTCACGCGRPLGDKNDARGLAGVCYARLEARHRRGASDELLDYPRRLRSADDVLDDWTKLRAQGATREEVAARLGMTLGGLERVLYRHRGDPRAVMGVRRRERVA